uniref:Putative molecular chaperone n=1 Tax=uncultured bacterium contig00060 TaxID=1181543 RepID=A0A806K0F9_9BACT|nr:putative molecular chaperone [uncultured bacterium contig00060]
MNLLAIDTACSVLSIAVAKDEDILYTETEAGIKHSELVMSYIDSQMKKASLKPSDLDGVLCMGGPGSFTGLRIGYSIAKGLALSLSIPFMAVPTLDCIAFSHNDHELVLPVIQAGKNSWFFTIFKNGSRLKQDADVTVDQITPELKNFSGIEKIILTGPGAALLYESLPQETVKNIVLDNKTCGYAKELILITKKNNLLGNFNQELLYSGPEYVRNAN